MCNGTGKITEYKLIKVTINEPESLFNYIDA